MPRGRGGLRDGEKKSKGWRLLIINFIVQHDLLNCFGFHFDKKVKRVNSYAVSVVSS